jgi:hypothetical protein
MKIKFLDTGEVIEVTTSQQLANTKVRVTPETSRQIQEAAFKLEFYWALTDKEIKHLTCPFLFIEGTGLLMAGTSVSNFVCQKGYREFEIIPPIEVEGEPSGNSGELPGEDNTDKVNELAALLQHHAMCDVHLGVLSNPVDLALEVLEWMKALPEPPKTNS